MIVTNFFFTRLLLFFIVLTSRNYSQIKYSNNKLVKNYKNKLVIIYVHGTFGLKEALDIKHPFFSFYFFLHLIHNKKKNNFLKKYKKMRWMKDKNYFSSIMNTKKGLVYLKNNIQIYKNFSYQAAQNIFFLKYYFFEYYLDIIKDSEPPEMYVYNWSGSLSALDRKNESKKFYSDLENLQLAYKKKFINSIFCIIGYSHGGNLVLDVPIEYVTKTKTNIRYLVLLGIPIIDSTKKNIFLKNKSNKYFFQHIVNIYSLEDRIQTLDITDFNQSSLFGIKHNFGFSKRTFSDKNNRNNVYNISCYYFFSKKKKLPNNFKFSSVESQILYLSHSNLTNFKNNYKKIIKKKQYENIYFPPVLFLVPYLLTIINKNEIKNENNLTVYFQYERNLLYITKKEDTNFLVKKVHYLNNLYENYMHNLLL